MALITLATLRDYWKKVYDNIIAHDAADSGDPLKVGGKASTTAPTAVSVGDRVNAWFDLNGRLVVNHDLALPEGTNNIGDVDVLTIPSLVAGTAIIGKIGIDQTTPGTTNGIQINAALPAGTNNIGDVDVLTLPATNTEGTALASLVRTVTVSSADIANNAGKGIHIILDVTAVSTSDVKMKIEGKDLASGKYYTILESASVTTVSTNIYKVHPNLTASPNLVANDLIPKTFRVTMTHVDADSITYSIGYSLV